MKQREIIQSELNDLGASFLMQCPNRMPFDIPENYNKQFVSDLFESINAQEIISKLPPQLPYNNVPENYFNGLGNQILNKIKLEKDTTEENVGWGNEMLFAVPSGYFENFPQEMLQKVKKSTSSRRIPLYRTVQLAASVALIVFVGLAALKMNRQNTTLSIDALSQEEIAQYVHENIDDFDTDIVLQGMSFDKVYPGAILNDVSNQEIETYLYEDGLD